MKKIFNFINHLGPGILLASAAIGTSHLIQSTRAGAYFGLELLWVIVIINCFKYPFIEYGFRYASATGNNLLYGYKQLSTYYLIFFLITNIISAIGGVALLAYLTAGIAKSVLGSQLDINTLSMISPITNEEKQKLLESISMEEKIKVLTNIINFYLHGINLNNQTIQ